MPRKFAVQLLPQAKKQFDSILDYILLNFQDPFAAESVERAIQNSLASLAVAPEQGALVNEDPFFTLGYRRIHAKKYNIFYAVDREKHTVTVLAIAHGSRNFKAILKALISS